MRLGRNRRQFGPGSRSWCPGPHALPRRTNPERTRALELERCRPDTRTAPRDLREAPTGDSTHRCEPVTECSRPDASRTLGLCRFARWMSLRVDTPAPAQGLPRWPALHPPGQKRRRATAPLRRVPRSIAAAVGPAAAPNPAAHRGQRER